ncbi:MAG: extracellular solute-binding protein [Pseudomonadota bacterium]
MPPLPSRRPAMSRSLARPADRVAALLVLYGGGLAVLMALTLALSLGSPARAETCATPEADENGIIRAHGISAFGELKYCADFPHFDYVNPDAPKGGTFSTWAFGTFDSLSPYILKGTAAQLSSVFFDTLLTGSADEPDAAYGLVAESVEYPVDRSWVIFNMRPEAQFWDGTPVTADDVVFSYNILLEKGRPSYQVSFEDVVAAEALDTHRVKFTFQEGAATRDLPSLVGGIPIFSEAYYAERDFAESSLETPLGSGPYEVGDIDPGRTITYVRRDDYWAWDLPIMQGRLNFDEIRLEYYADYTAAFEGFKGGGYNYREEFSSSIWANQYNFPALDAGHVRIDVLPDGRPSGTQGFWFNLRRDKFADPRVREAIGMVFNFEWSNETLFFDLYDRTASFWQNSHLAAEGPVTDAELALLEPFRAELPASLFEEPAYVPQTSSPRRQLDRRMLRDAGALLDAAGWTVVDGTRQNAEGEVLEIEILNDSPTFDRIINPFVQNLQRLGIEAIVARVDNAQAAEREKSFDFDITTRRYVMSLTPAGTSLRTMFGSQTAEVEGSNNIAGVAHPVVDAMIDAVDDAESREELDTAVRALDRVLRALHIWVPHWYKGVHHVAYRDVFGRPEALPPYSIGTTDFWWWDADKAARLRAAGAL